MQITFVLPAFLAVILPFLLTVAIFLFLLLHFTFAFFGLFFSFTVFFFPAVNFTVLTESFGAFAFFLAAADATFETPFDVISSAKRSVNAHTERITLFFMIQFLLLINSLYNNYSIHFFLFLAFSADIL